MTKIDRNYIKQYTEWVKDGKIICPDCACPDVLRCTIANEGEFFLCKKCKKKQKIGEDNYKIRRGFYRKNMYEL